MKKTLLKLGSTLTVFHVAALSVFAQQSNSGEVLGESDGNSIFSGRNLLIALILIVIAVGAFYFLSRMRNTETE